MNYFLIHVHEYDGDYFKDLADLLRDIPAY